MIGPTGGRREDERAALPGMDGGEEGGVGRGRRIRREAGGPLYRSITRFLHHSSKLCGMQTRALGEGS